MSLILAPMVVVREDPRCVLHQTDPSRCQPRLPAGRFGSHSQILHVNARYIMSKIDPKKVLQGASNFDPNAILRGAQLTLVGGLPSYNVFVNVGG